MFEILDTVLIVVHIMLVVALIGLVLLQRSEGGALGIGGGGGGGGFMSARSAADTLTKTTTIVAAAFFLTSILLGISAKTKLEATSVIERVEDAVNTGVPTEGDAKTAPSGGSLLDDLNTEGQSAPTTGVPTDQ
ncbi:preprotein translocase subunit SecG [Ahrensia sp. AH-315-G08]|nr:preprotein translocase subunit SecG [Ahrensia sp. AH-315-G08]